MTSTVEVDARTRAAAAALRSRAESFRPDEDLQTSIEANAIAGEAFAGAYEALRARNLTDKALDEFGVENATPARMREAADLLEQLARAEEPPPKKKHYQRMSRKQRREFRFASVLVLIFATLFLAMFGAFFVRNSISEFKDWQLARAVAGGAAPPVVPAVPATVVAPALAPVDSRYETTAANQIVPVKPRDFVTDRAAIFPAERARLLNAQLMQFERETTNQLLVFVDQRVPPQTTLPELGAASIQHWGVGQKDKDNGVIFFVFLADRDMRIEVGYGLEGVLTDARASRILRQIVRPLFKQGRYEDGIEAGVRAIMEVTRDGDAAIDRVTLASGAVRVSVPWLLFNVLVSAGFFVLLVMVVRSFILFQQGYQNGIFRIGRGRGGRGGRDGSSGSDSGGGSSGSYSGGGGSGGGGGASDSW